MVLLVFRRQEAKEPSHSTLCCLRSFATNNKAGWTANSDIPAEDILFVGTSGSLKNQRTSQWFDVMLATINHVCQSYAYRFEEALNDQESNHISGSSKLDQHAKARLMRRALYDASR